MSAPYLSCRDDHAFEERVRDTMPLTMTWKMIKYWYKECIVVCTEALLRCPRTAIRKISMH
jgi:hypothetical protein